MNYTNEETLQAKNIKIENYLPYIGIERAKEEIISGLKSVPKRISSKFFYDEKGSLLFEEITKLEEYYPTRTEKSILKKFRKIFDFDYTDYAIVELGSGDASKISLLLSSIPEKELSSVSYIPVDISTTAVQEASEQLILKFPDLKINGIVADFMTQLHVIPNEDKRLFCFFGSTIGNFEMVDVEDFMSQLGAVMKKGDSLLLGMDMLKDILVLEKAYNDKRGITAKFNLNILNVVNNLIISDFDITAFEHFSFFNKEKQRIEMHLKALKNMIINIGNGKEQLEIKKGETIHTENSNKFSSSQIEELGVIASLSIQGVFTDENNWFSLVHYKKE